jgi:dephospho-CoA kinase
MKLICITGNSGSGKSTVAKMFCDILPNSLLIRADDYMWKWAKHNIAEYRRIFEISQESTDFDECRRLSRNMTSEQLQNFVATVTPFVENDLEEAISSQKNNKYSYVVTEWAGLYKFKIWNRADYRILINVQESIRVKKLVERLVASGRYSDAGISARIVPVQDILEIVSNPSFIIENNYDDDLYIKIQHICSSINSKKTDSL